MTREQTAAYCAERGLPWREDATNATSARGRIRSTLLPALRELHPAAEENILRTLATLRDEAAVLDAAVDAALRGSDPLSGGLRRSDPGVELRTSPALARLVLQRLADDATAGGGPGPSIAAHADAILALGDEGTASLDLPGGLRAISEYGRLRIERGGAVLAPAAVALPVPGRVAYGGGELVCELDTRPAIADGTLAAGALVRHARGPAVAQRRPDAAARSRRQPLAAGPLHRPQGAARAALAAARGRLRRRDRVGPGRRHGRAFPCPSGHPRAGAAGLAPRLRDPMSEEIGEILVQADDLQHRIRAMAEDIARDYEGKDLLLIGVLKGAFLFLADLMRHLDVGCEVDFMAVASYGSSTESSGVVRILKDLDAPLEGRHVLIVEDIVDSGLTLQYLLRTLEARGPASLEVCALLTKPSRRTVDLPVRYTGFEIPDKFAIGYGLDYAERYRNLPYVAALVLTDD